MRHLALAVTLSLQAVGASIVGTTSFEGGVADPPINVTGIRISLVRPTDGDVFRRASVGILPMDRLPGAFVGDRGQFSIDGLSPGTYFLTVAFLQRPWKLASAVLDGKSILDSGITVAEGTSQPMAVALTFSARPTLVRGEVRWPDGRRAVSCTVVAFPENRLRWLIPGARLQTSVCDPGGRYAIQDMLPGRYSIAAVVDMRREDLGDIGFFSRISKESVSVVLGDGQHLTHDLQIVK